MSQNRYRPRSGWICVADPLVSSGEADAALKRQLKEKLGRNGAVDGPQDIFAEIALQRAYDYLFYLRIAQFAGLSGTRLTTQ